MPRLKRGMTTREVADRGLSLAKGCLAPAELSTCLHRLGFVWPTVVLFISKHCFHYRFAGWLCSRKSWLRLRKTSKMVVQCNQDGRRQMTAAIAWCRRIKRHSLRRPGAGHRGATCEGANPGFLVNNRKFTGIFSLAS
jgi:hypothetical protein